MTWELARVQRVVPRSTEGMPPKEVWIGGITQRVDTDTSALPPPPAHTNPSPMAIGALRQVAVDMAPWLAGATQLSQGCCLLQGYCLVPGYCQRQNYCLVCG